jgi:hypothetical protein
MPALNSAGRCDSLHVQTRQLQITHTPTDPLSQITAPEESSDVTFIAQYARCITSLEKADIQGYNLIATVHAN